MALVAVKRTFLEVDISTERSELPRSRSLPSRRGGSAMAAVPLPQCMMESSDIDSKVAQAVDAQLQRLGALLAGLIGHRDLERFGGAEEMVTPSISNASATSADGAKAVGSETPTMTVASESSPGASSTSSADEGDESAAGKGVASISGGDDESGSDVGDLDMASLFSVGSALHDAGGCKPCTFHRFARCKAGPACLFCHVLDGHANIGKSRLSKNRRDRLKRSIRKMDEVLAAGTDRDIRSL